MIGDTGREASQRKADRGAGAAGDRGGCAGHIGAVGGVQPVVKSDGCAASIGIHRTVQHSCGSGHRAGGERDGRRLWRSHQGLCVVGRRAATHQHEFLAGCQSAGADSHGHTALCGAVVAEFTIRIVAPACKRSIRAQGHALVRSGAHGDDCFASKGSASGRHRHRDAAIRGRVVAQLAVVVIAPGGDGAI